MKNDRQTNMFPFPGMMPMNQMMYPNYMNEGCQNFENRISNIEKKIKTVENRLDRLENPYGNNNQNQNLPYQTTQNGIGYNGEMYMM